MGCQFDFKFNPRKTGVWEYLEGRGEYFLWGYNMGLGMSDGRESGHDDDRWKILNFSKIQILGIQSDLKEARG